MLALNQCTSPRNRANFELLGFFRCIPTPFLLYSSVLISKWLEFLTYYFTLSKAALGKHITVTLSLLLTAAFFAQSKPAEQFLENGRGTYRGPDAGMFPDTPFRQKIDLAGVWQYTRDGKSLQPIAVPSAYDFPGKVTFQRTFTLTGELLDNHVFTLVVYGINYQSEISINGTYVTRHVGGFSSFTVPIGENILQEGAENVISISVDNTLTPRTTIPPRQYVGGWRNYGGIFRDIYLLATPKLFIGETDVKTSVSPDYKTAKLRIRSTIENRGHPLADSLMAREKPVKGEFVGYIAELYDKLSGAVVTRGVPIPLDVKQKSSTSVTAELIVTAPKLWSPATPDLYVLKCSIVYVRGKEVNPLDEFDLNVGIRDLQLKESSIILNGKRTTLQGVVWREDHPLFGSAMTYEAMERDVVQIKGLGANLVRFLYPPHPYVLNLCDRYGLFVMEEIPYVAVPREVMKDDEYQELTENYLKEMVLRDRHRVSVFAWGLGDEFDGRWVDQPACEILATMRQVVSSLDERPPYYATSRLMDECLDEFPLLVVNAFSQDSKEFRQFLVEWQKRFPSKTVIVGRHGKSVQPGNRNGYSDPLSYEAQARYAMQHHEVVKDLRLAGSVWWSFSDWRGDRPSLSTYSGDPYLHTSGLVNYNREKRLAYDILRASFTGEKIAALPIGNYSASSPIVFVLVGLLALIAFAFLYNGNRRFRENIHRGLTRTYNFYADVRDQRILSYAHSLFLSLVVAVTWATVLSSILTHYRNDLVFDNLLSHILPDGIKEWLILLVWNPPQFILLGTGIILVFLLLLSLLVLLSSFVARTRVTIYHSVGVAVWSMLPFIILIPVAMILHRILETPLYVVPSFLLIGLLGIWAMYRFFKGVSVIFDVYPLKVFVVGIIIIVCSLALAYGYLDYTQSATLYLRHLIGTTAVIPIPSM